MGKMPEYLYQYTSIETLALILKNKTIRFNSLQNVDDLEEVQSGDIKNFGKFTFVSCWTDDENESIALWNMYTEKMKGVRIKLKSNCLKNEYNLIKEQVDKNNLYIPTFKKGSILNNVSKFQINLDFFELRKVQYSDSLNKLNPEIIKKRDDGKYYTNIVGLGEWKRTQWRFQNEWRYIIYSYHKDIKAEEYSNKNDYIKDIERFTDIPEGIYANITDEGFENMEIILGPNTTEADRIIVQALVDKYNNKISVIEDSFLKGKVRNKR